MALSGPNALRISALHSTGNVYFGIVTNCCDLSLLAPPCGIVLASGDLQERIMQTPIPLDGPIDLERLDEFLASDRAPAECMQLSELDGFLTGVAVGPELIPPSVWLPMIWHDDEPGYADMEEAQTILGIIMRRYNEIIRLVDSFAGVYRPVLVEQDDGTVDASDWAVGFLQAMAICQDAWEPLVMDRTAGALIAPIMLIASTTDLADLPLDDDERLPDDEMAKLLAEADMMLGLCASGIRKFFQRPRAPARRKGPARARSKRR
jgi:uncharacterized protein